jgi:rhodanese-related sulfurtransferase
LLSAAPRPIVVHCQSGYRSAIAASLLERHGISRFADLVGGFAAWEASQLATVAASAATA